MCTKKRHRKTGESIKFNSEKTDNPTKNWLKMWKDNHQRRYMDGKCMQICSSLVREMQIKTPMRYLYTLIRMTETKTLKISNVGKDIV